MSSDDRRQQGLQKMNEVYGWEMPDIQGDPYFDLTVEHLFGTIWTRPGVVDAGQAPADARRGDGGGKFGSGRDPDQRRTAQREITAEELKEVSVFLTHYLGFPLGSKLDGAVSKVVRQRKKAAERGAGEDKKGNVNAAVKMHSGGSVDEQ